MSTEKDAGEYQRRLDEANAEMIGTLALGVILSALMEFFRGRAKIEVADETAGRKFSIRFVV